MIVKDNSNIIISINNPELHNQLNIRFHAIDVDTNVARFARPWATIQIYILPDRS